MNQYDVNTNTIIGSDESSHLVGGTLRRDSKGNFITNEDSGHYGENWTDEIRQKFKNFVESITGKKIEHKKWGEE